MIVWSQESGSQEYLTTQITGTLIWNLVTVFEDHWLLRNNVTRKIFQLQLYWFFQRDLIYTQKKKKMVCASQVHLTTN